MSWKLNSRKDTGKQRHLHTDILMIPKIWDCIASIYFHINLRLFRKILTLSLPLQVKHSKDHFPESNGALLITCIQITSAIGRLVFGKVADFDCVNIVYLQQASFVLMSIVLACIPLAKTFIGLIVISLVFGVSDGIFVFLIAPITINLVGSHNSGQAIGFVYCLLSIPFAIGPAVAGNMLQSIHLK